MFNSLSPHHSTSIDSHFVVTCEVRVADSIHDRPCRRGGGPASLERLMHDCSDSGC